MGRKITIYCILVTGIPAAGKSTIADFLAEAFSIPGISKDKMKELLYDDVGFQSREEKILLCRFKEENTYLYCCGKEVNNDERG